MLPRVTPTPEQLPVVSDFTPGTTLIRGAAGTGKTTTGLLRLDFLINVWLSRQGRLGLEDPPRILVLTYNRTLRGYVAALAKASAASNAPHVQVSTFARWALDLVPGARLERKGQCPAMLRHLGRGFPLPEAFLLEEVEYVLGRFAPEDLDEYLTCRRETRGTAPRVAGPLRRRILEEVIAPYSAAKHAAGILDWNDLAVAAERVSGVGPYDIIVVDEAQDFSANQVRAVTAHLAPEHSLTFVLDGAQRIYPRFLTWREVGLDPVARYTLKENLRNTREIAALARPLVSGLDLTDDGTLPDFDKCTRNGPRPIVLVGNYTDQLLFAIDRLRHHVNLSSETVAFLHARGGGWFAYTERVLTENGFAFHSISRESEWPEDTINVALSTFHSAKGLEFDHVFVLGLDEEVTPNEVVHGEGHYESWRRLLAMAIGRARLSVTIGHQDQKASTLLSYLDPLTFDQVAV